MTGKIAGVVIVGSAVAAGILMYYLQLYAFYDELPPDSVDIRLTSLTSGAPEPLLVGEVEAIDSDSSPLRFRACFTTGSSNVALSEEFVLYDAAEPLVAPRWFDCFDAADIGAALENGTALAFLSEAGIRDGVDRVVAILDDGRGFAWHQLNAELRD